MEKQIVEKKLRWSVAKAMSCVCETVQDSKLRIKETNDYKTAIKRLTSLYDLTATQIWILCLVCERYFNKNKSTSMKDLSEAVGTPAMSIIGWKADVQSLIERGFLEWDKYNVEFQPVREFCDSLYDNDVFVPQEKHEMDEIEFLNTFAEKYESRRREDMRARQIQYELMKYEHNYENLDMIKRVIKEIETPVNRFILYDVANDVLEGDDSGLNATISDLYDGNERYNVAKDMMEERHELFTKGLIEFTQKGNLSDATISLTEKGKKLVLGEKAALFEDALNDKNLIKADSIKAKKLFYSPENEKQVARLKNALADERLKEIQKRLEADGLPVGIAVLLYGAPGTGKTESVMQIARETGRHIVHVDISESKSAWFGESEKRIKKVFTSYRNVCEICEKKGEKIPILLFNEADAIISKRKDSTAGNVAQTENAIQNIILEELENLKGIFIATTNLAENMDAAFERRFLFKIKFENPSEEAKAAIWMSKLSWMDERGAKTLAAEYDFSGGQIDNIVRKIAMDEIIIGKRPNEEEIREMCRSEKLNLQGVGNRIGFGV